MIGASIALQPIATDLSHLAPTRPRVELGDRAPVRPEVNLGQSTAQRPVDIDKTKREVEIEIDEPVESALTQIPEEEPLPRGAMFAAAIIAGQLSPKPETMEEVILRAGIGWTPPDSDFRLTDLTI